MTQNNASSHYSKKIANNALWLMVVEILIRAIGLGTVMMKTRYLGPSEFGVLGFITTLSTLFLIIPDLGIFNVLIRDLSKNPKDPHALIFQSLCVRFVLSLFAWGGMLFYLKANHYDSIMIHYGWIAGISIWSQSWIWIFVATYQCRLQMKYVALFNLMVALLHLLGTWLCIHYQLSLNSFVWLFTIYSMLLCLCLGIYSYYRYHWEIAFNLKNLKNLIHESWPLWFSAAFLMIYNKIDIVMLSRMSTYTSIGYYHCAIKFLEPALSLGNAVVSSLIPIYIQLKESHQSVHQYLEKSFKILFSLGWIIAISISCVGSLMLKLFFGNDFVVANHVLNLLIWSTIFTFQTYFLSNLMIYLHKQRMNLFFGLFLVLLNISLNLLWIPLYDELGAGMATLFTELVQIILFVAYLRNKLEHFPFVFIVKGIILSGIFCIYFYTNSGVMLWIGIPIFIFSVYVLKAIQIKDVKMLCRVVFNKNGGAFES